MFTFPQINHRMPVSVFLYQTVIASLIVCLIPLTSRCLLSLFELGVSLWCALLLGHCFASAWKYRFTSQRGAI